MQFWLEGGDLPRASGKTVLCLSKFTPRRNFLPPSPGHCLACSEPSELCTGRL